MVRPAMVSFGWVMMTGCILERSGDDDPAVSDDEPAQSGWTESTGPCQGYRTETIAVQGGVHYVGCGSDLGLFTASSATGTFSVVEALSDFHVYEVASGPDGALWATGDEASGTELIYRLDDAPEALLSYDGSSMRLSAAENLVVAGDGTVYTDSLTGNYWADSSNEGASWSEHYLSSYQIMDLAVDDDGQVMGCGSTISQPPTVFVLEDGDFTAVELSGPHGALEGIAWTGERWVVVGVDEDTELATLYTCSSDCGSASSWASVDLAELASDAGKLWSVHADGGHVIVVGERYPQAAGGVIFVSDDAGTTWSLVDEDVPLLSVGYSYGNGDFAVGGGDTFWMTGAP